MRYLRFITPVWIASDCSYREIRSMHQFCGLRWWYAWLPGYFTRRRIAEIERLILVRAQGAKVIK